MPIYRMEKQFDRLGINPLEYITDVLERISDHPHAAIDDLLPDRWRPPNGSG
jgi:hypothetical protein